MSHLFVPRNHPLRPQFLERLQRGRQQPPDLSAVAETWPDTFRQIQAYNRQRDERRAQVQQALAQLLPQIKRPVNWNLIKENAENPARVDEIKALFEQLQQAQKAKEAYLADPPDSFIEAVTSKPPTLREQFDDLIRAAKFEKALKYPELYKENVQFWLSRLAKHHTPSDLAALYDEFKMLQSAEECARLSVGLIDFMDRQWDRLAKSEKHYHEIDTGDLEEMLVKKLTNDAEGRSLREIREKLADKAIPEGAVQVIDPPYNPLEPWETIYTYEVLSLPDRMYKDYRFVMKEIPEVTDWDAVEKSFAKAREDPKYKQQMKDEFYHKIRHSFYDWRDGWLPEEDLDHDEHHHHNHPDKKKAVPDTIGQTKPPGL